MSRLLPFLLFLPFVLGVEHYQPERILDVRQVIKDALDMMRNYPAPTQLIPAVQQPQQSTQQQPQMQNPTTAYYAQQHQSYYPQRRQYGSTTYNGGVESQVDRTFGARADSQPTDYASQMTRWFAQPTQDDMKKLFHLPADILHRLAADAGYIQPSEESSNFETSNFKKSDSDQSFNFNIEGHGGDPKDLNSFITSLQNPQATSTQLPVVDVVGPPKITTRQILKDGKYVSIPILIVPQKNGENIYVPFSDMKQLSEAVNKIITTGHYQFTTPPNPDADKPFPMPGPMLETGSEDHTQTAPEDHVQIEPTMATERIIKQTKTDGAFVQSVGDETNSNEDQNKESSNEEESTVITPKIKSPTTSTMPTTKATISPKPRQIESKKVKTKKEKQDEIVLNGQRYKLVAVEEKSAEVSTETTTASSASNEQEEVRTPKFTNVKDMNVKEPRMVVRKNTESKILHANLASTNDQLLPMTFNLTEQRQYSLKELEELYNKENALERRGDGLDDSDSLTTQRQRILELREKFARDRLELAKKTTETFYKIKPVETQKANEFDNKCVFLKAFARKYGVVDVEQFAKNNCLFIQEALPDLKCKDISNFITECKSKFML